MSAKLQKFKDNTKLIAMCGNILFVLNEYVNMIVDSRLIGDNHLDHHHFKHQTHHVYNEPPHSTERCTMQ